MLRRLLMACAAVEVLFPRTVIDFCEQIGLENPGEARLRPFATGVARLEGLVVIWVLRRGRANAPVVSTVLASAGALALVHPRPLIRLTQEFAYENTADLELRPWVVLAARALGGLYLLVVLLSGSDTR